MTWKSLEAAICLATLLIACAEVSLDGESSGKSDPQDSENLPDDSDPADTSDGNDTSDTEDSDGTRETEIAEDTQGTSDPEDTGGNGDTEDTTDTVPEHCGDGRLNPDQVDAHLEDFEAGDLPSTSWIQGPNYGFELTSEYVHGGAYSLHPANGGVSSSTARISIEAYTDGTICFWIYGRSSDNWFFGDYDYLYFYIDENLQASWLGSHTSWDEYCATTGPGWRTFTWEYEKDASGSSVIDSYFIDDIRFADAYREQCDDGNNTSGDGCSASCNSE